jgi:hypothetical protein
VFYFLHQKSLLKLVVINIRQNQNLTDFFGCNEKIDITTEQENSVEDSVKTYTVIAIIISVFIFVISLIVVFAISMLYI